MMPGVGFAEMILLALVAIVVIGPKDLPLMMRKFGRFTGKMRALAFEFKQGFDELGRQAELEELRKEVADLKKHTGLEDLQKDFEQDRVNLSKDVDSAMAPASLPHPGEARPEAMDRSGGSIQGPNAQSAESKDAALTHPAAAANASAEPAPVAPYAGLSADHPGYDTGETPEKTPEKTPGQGATPAPGGEGASAEPNQAPLKQSASA